MAITTFTRITAKDPSANLLEEGSAAGKGFMATIDDALAQSACQRVHYGREVEDSSNYWVFAEWDTVQDRLAYVQSEGFQAVSKGLFDHIDGTKTLSKHFTPSAKLNSPETLFGADGLGAIEVLSVHFPNDLSDADKAESERLWKEFQAKGLETSPDLRGGVSGGWSVEKDVPVLGEGSGEGVALMLLLGWTSVEAHVANRAKEAFLQAVPFLLEHMPRRCGLFFCHVKPITRSK